MSFKETFTTTYKKGDLFYGFGVPRLSLMKFLGVPTSESGLSALFMINNYMGTGDEIAGQAAKTQVAVDKFNLAEEERFKVDFPEYDKVRALKWNDPVKKAFLEMVATAFAIAKPDLEAAFKASLLKPHEDFWEALRTFNGGKYASALTFKRSDAPDGTADSAENSAWRKKCKGGIYYGTHVLDCTVHFCLSLEQKTGNKVTGYCDMDFAAVVKKSSPTDTPATATKENKIRLITPAELRWVYRHRDNASVQKNVQFWTHGTMTGDDMSWVACGPPWEKDAEAAELWSSYKPKSTSVHAKAD